MWQIVLHQKIAKLADTGAGIDDDNSPAVADP
jgi:hypothetical protein